MSGLNTSFLPRLKILSVCTSPPFRNNIFSVLDITFLIFCGQRVVIPEKFQQYVLDEIHDSHLGMTQMKELSRKTVYWKNIDLDIEAMVKGCKECGRFQNVRPKVKIINGINQQSHGPACTWILQAQYITNSY